MLDTSKSVHHLLTSPGVILVGRSSEMKKGNCCEHYLAATKEGWILNFGGEYQLGQKIEVTLGRNILRVYYLR